MHSPTLKSTSLQAYRMLLYRRPLHPELFEIHGRRAIDHGAYEFELWAMQGAHLMRFHHNGGCVTELVTDADLKVDSRGLAMDIPCAVERDHEEDITESIRHLATVQTEALPENLYKATYDELVEFGDENDALIHLWENPQTGKCASIIATQRFRKEVHTQAYHLHAQGGLVLRTQSIFEHVAKK